MIQVFLYSSPCNIPVQFANHHWFVINRDGVLSRWEVLHRKDGCNTSWGHLHKNFFKPFIGLEMFLFLNKPNWRSKCLGSIEGDNSSSAGLIASFIEKSPETYPYCHKYSLTGPNSNTYAQWVLDKFPEFKIVLSHNSIGKDYPH